MADLKSELGAEVVAQTFTKFLSGAGAWIMNVFFDRTGKVRDEARTYLFGNKETDEQIFKRAMAYAVKGDPATETVPLITEDERDTYLLALAELPRERQNDYRRHVIQTWAEKEVKPEDIIKSTAEVLAHDAKLVAHSDAWKASLPFFDLDQSILPPLNLEERIQRLRKRNQELDRKSEKFWSRLRIKP